MIFLSGQPANTYYAWHVEVMLNNFIEQGVNPDNIHIVCNIPNGKIPEQWVKLQKGYDARFYFYEDTRTSKKYQPGLRGNLFAKHWQSNKWLKNETIFYHDADILFTKQIDFKQFEQDDICYGSDTISYIGYDYIRSKGMDIVQAMASEVGIHPSLIKANQNNSIGAQYIIKEADSKLWQKVSEVSELMFNKVKAISDLKYKLDNKYHPVQIWCSDMWVLLWSLWMRGYQTKISDELSFSWGTHDADSWNKHNIFHNAGVTSKHKDLFRKFDFIDKLPYNTNLKIKPNTTSKIYYDYIQSIGQKSVLI